MAFVELLTKSDLENFKKELLADLADLLAKKGAAGNKKWLRTAEVRKLLGVSPGTLQNLRINGTLPYSKVDSLFYYKLEDIEKMLNEGERNGRFGN